MVPCKKYNICDWFHQVIDLSNLLDVAPGAPCLISLARPIKIRGTLGDHGRHAFERS